MNCERIQELYTDYYEKSVSGTLLEAVDHHFKVCTDCRTDYARFEMAMKLLDVDIEEVEAPTSFRADILAKIEAQPRKPSVAIGIWDQIASIFNSGDIRQRYQLVTGFSVAAVLIVATLFTGPIIKMASNTGNMGITIPGRIKGQPQYFGLFRDISTETRSDGRTYHDFTLHLPAGQTSGTMDAYVIQDDKPLLDDSALTDYSSVTPVWSDSKTLDADHSLNVPVAVVSDVPADNTLTFMIKETDNSGATRREVAFVPVNGPGSPTWNASAIPAGTSLFNTLETVASSGTVPIVLDSSVIYGGSSSATSRIETFQAAATDGTDTSEQMELQDALKSDSSLKVVVPQTDDAGNPEVLAIVAK
jgi:hypothetical protein